MWPFCEYLRPLWLFLHIPKIYVIDSVYIRIIYVAVSVHTHKIMWMFLYIPKTFVVVSVHTEDTGACFYALWLFLSMPAWFPGKF